MLAAFAVGIGAAAGRLGFDSLLQRDGPDAVRGRAFARVRDAVPAGVGDRRDHRRSSRSPRSSGSSCSRSCSRSAAVVLRRRAARRARRGACARSCMPEAVDRAHHASRDQALDRVRRRFKKPATADRRPAAARAVGGLLVPAAGRAAAPCRRGRPASGSSRPSACRPARGWRCPSSTTRFASWIIAQVHAVGDEAPRAARRVVDHDRVLAARGRDLDDGVRRSRRSCPSARTISARRITTGGDAQCHPITSSGRAGHLRELADREARRVRRQDRVRGRGGVEVAEHLLLELELLGHRFDDEVDVGGVVERRVNDRRASAASASSRAELAPLDAALEAVATGRDVLERRARAHRRRRRNRRSRTPRSPSPARSRSP